jgi:uncharacterized protein
VKADPAAQRRLLDLAGLDAELARAQHRRRTLPEQTAVEEAEAAVRTRRDAVVRAQTSVTDLGRDVAKLDQEVAQVRAREERDRKLVDSGSVSSKQVTDLSHELDTLSRRRGVLEDEQLEVMEQREAVGSDAAHAGRVLAEAEQEQSTVAERRDTALLDIDAAEAGRRRAREEVVATLPADLLAEYDRRQAGGGIGAALLRERRCGACRLELDRTALSALRAAPPDDVVHCEECGVVLVRTPESGL